MNHLIYLGKKANIHTSGFFSKGKKGQFPVPSSCKPSQWNNRNWYGLRMASDRKAPQLIVKTDPSIIGTQAAHLPSISDIGELRCLHRAQRILKEPAQPQPACSRCCRLTRGIEYLLPHHQTTSSFFPQDGRLFSSSTVHHEQFVYVTLLSISNLFVSCFLCDCSLQLGFCNLSFVFTLTMKLIL